MAKFNRIPDRDFILKQMYRGVVGFSFTKKDGELREMQATLVTNLIDPKFIKESSANPPDGDKSIIVCWDVENSGWRSFHVDTLKEYNGILWVV
jgi:hypothetical protein